MPVTNSFSQNGGEPPKSKPKPKPKPKPVKHGKAAAAQKAHKQGKPGSACYRKNCVKK
jgi:hypothetical protein